MNRPSNRRPAWLGFGVACSCCGLLFVGGMTNRATTQEKPGIAPSESRDPQVRLPEAAAPATKSNLAPEFLPRLSPNEEKIVSALNETTEVAFVDSPLHEVFNVLKDLHGVEIWVDKESLTADGIATDQLVNLSISGVTLRSALRLMLEPMTLTYVIEDEVLKITTQDKASERLMTRTYPVGDLFESQAEANDLIEVIVSGLGLKLEKKTVTCENRTGLARNATHPGIRPADPVGDYSCNFGLTNNPAIDSGDSTQTKMPVTTPDVISMTHLLQQAVPEIGTTTTGIGTMTVSFKARAIVARQTHAVHDQIRQLLRDLREAKSFAPAQPLTEWGVPGGRHPRGYAPPSTSIPSKPPPLDEFSPGFRPDNSPPRRTLSDPDQDELAPPAKLPAPPKSGAIR